MKVTCSITLSIKVREQLEKLSRETGKPMNEIVESALEDHFARIKTDTKKKK